MLGALRQLSVLQSLHCLVTSAWQHCLRAGVLGHQQVKKLIPDSLVLRLISFAVAGNCLHS